MMPPMYCSPLEKVLQLMQKNISSFDCFFLLLSVFLFPDILAKTCTACIQITQLFQNDQKIYTDTLYLSITLRIVYKMIQIEAHPRYINYNALK